MVFMAMAITVFVAALHLYFLWLEMVKWEEPRTRKIFGTTEEFASASRVLAANQGLYNGFLGVGLLLGLILGSQTLVLYLLLCVLVAGIYGAFTVSIRILLVQAAPALLALLLYWFA